MRDDRSTRTTLCNELFYRTNNTLARPKYEYASEQLNSFFFRSTFFLRLLTRGGPWRLNLAILVSRGALIRKSTLVRAIIVDDNNNITFDDAIYTMKYVYIH